MIEALSKNSILVIFVLCSVCFSDDNTYDFVFGNMLPFEISQNSFGIRIIDSEDKIRTYFNYQSWATENLFFDGYVSPSFDNDIDITYGINLGYSASYDNAYFKNINYAIGYFRKKFSDDLSKWTNLAVIPLIKIKDSWLSLSFNYSFYKNNNDTVNKTSLIFNYMKLLNDNLIFKTGIQLFDQENDLSIYHFIGLNYTL